jgi:hypothetical protein
MPAGIAAAFSANGAATKLTTPAWWREIQLRDRLGWAALGMAASLALLIGYQQLRPALNAVPQEFAARDRAEAEDVALAWFHATENRIDANDEDLATVEMADEALDLPAVNALQKANAPVWMVTALQTNRTVQAPIEN